MSKFNLKKFILEDKLDKNLQQLNENSPGYDTRKSGEPLPTLESVKAAFEKTGYWEYRIKKVN